MTDALKLCPFCGSDHVRINGGPNSSYVECLECSVEGPFSDFTEAQAASAWNRRHVAVTDEMVERALWVMFPYPYDEHLRKNWRPKIVEALTAALSGDADE